MVSARLVSIITDGLARIAGNGLFPHWTAMFLTNETDAGNLAGRFVVTSAQEGEDDDALNSTFPDVDNSDIVFDRYGYRYRWEGSGTAQFGITVLLIQGMHVSCRCQRNLSSHLELVVCTEEKDRHSLARAGRAYEVFLKAPPAHAIYLSSFKTLNRMC